MGRTIRFSGRKRRSTEDSSLQYSLFGAHPLALSAEARHFRRQAALCERLLGTLHQPELIEALDRLHREFAQAAERIESA